MGKVECQICQICQASGTASRDQYTFKPHLFQLHMKNEHNQVILDTPTGIMYADMHHYQAFLETYGKTDLVNDYVKIKVDLMGNYPYIEENEFKLKTPKRSKHSESFLNLMKDFERTQRNAPSYSSLLPHQKFLLSFVQNLKVSNRHIVVVCDSVGNSGKTKLFDYMGARENYLRFSGTTSEITRVKTVIQSTYAYAPFFSDINSNSKMTIAINLARSTGKDVDKVHKLCGELENLIDGRLSSQGSRNIHAILLLTNWTVEFAGQLAAHMSSDRLIIFQIVEKCPEPKLIDMYMVAKSKQSNVTMNNYEIPLQTFYYLSYLPPDIVASLIRNKREIVNHLHYDKSKHAMSASSILDDDAKVTSFESLLNSKTDLLPNLDKFYSSSCILDFSENHKIILDPISEITYHEDIDFETIKKEWKRARDVVEQYKGLFDAPGASPTREDREMCNAAIQLEDKISKCIDYLFTRYRKTNELLDDRLGEANNRIYSIAKQLIAYFSTDTTKFFEKLLESGRFIPQDEPINKNPEELSKTIKEIHQQQLNLTPVSQSRKRKIEVCIIYTTAVILESAFFPRRLKKFHVFNFF